MAVSDRFARSSTSSNGSRLDVSSPSDSTTIAWRRISSAFFADDLLRDPSARCRPRCRATWSRRPTSCGSPARARAALFVKFCSTTTRLSKSMTSARSCGRSRCAKPIAASCAVGSFVFHAGARVEQQRQRDRQVRAVEERDVLLDAVFEDVEVALVEVGDVVVRRVRHRHVQRDEVDAGAEGAPAPAASPPPPRR